MSWKSVGYLYVIIPLFYFILPAIQGGAVGWSRDYFRRCGYHLPAYHRDRDLLRYRQRPR